MLELLEAIPGTAAHEIPRSIDLLPYGFVYQALPEPSTLDGITGAAIRPGFDQELAVATYASFAPEGAVAELTFCDNGLFDAGKNFVVSAGRLIAPADGLELHSGAIISGPAPCDGPQEVSCHGIDISDPLDPLVPGVVEVVAIADDFWNQLLTFEATNGDETHVVGPQFENTATFELTPGPWMIVLTVEDGSECPRGAGSQCAEEILITDPGSEPFFRRGDSNSDDAVDLSDALHTLGNIFLGIGVIDCPDAADANDDLAVDLTDPIFELVYLFLGGEAPAAPRPHTCGVDPTEDSLGSCESTACDGSTH
jgi:hypothetical protein